MLNAMEDTMSDANIKLVQDAYAAFGRGDIPAILDAMTDDVTIGIVGRKQDAPFFGIHSGKDGAAEFFKLLDEAHAISKFEPQRFLAAAEKVFVWGRYTWTMRRSGVSDTTSWFHEITVRDAKMAEWRGHNDTAMLAAHYHAAPLARRAANG
jgi:ketosteroid isomerase-like protein